MPSNITYLDASVPGMFTPLSYSKRNKGVRVYACVARTHTHIHRETQGHIFIFSMYMFIHTHTHTLTHTHTYT